MIRTDNLFIDIIADAGMELWNGKIATNRISAPLGTDVSQWIERVPEPIIEEMTLEELLLLEQKLLIDINL